MTPGVPSQNTIAQPGIGAPAPSSFDRAPNRTDATRITVRGKLCKVLPGVSQRGSDDGGTARGRLERYQSGRLEPTRQYVHLRTPIHRRQVLVSNRTGK